MLPACERDVKTHQEELNPLEKEPEELLGQREEEKRLPDPLAKLDEQGALDG